MLMKTRHLTHIIKDTYKYEDTSQEASDTARVHSGKHPPLRAVTHGDSTAADHTGSRSYPTRSPHPGGLPAAHCVG